MNGSFTFPYNTCSYIVYTTWHNRSLYKYLYMSRNKFKAAESVTFDLLILEIKFLFFKNTVKILKFRYSFYHFRKS